MAILFLLTFFAMYTTTVNADTTVTNCTVTNGAYGQSTTNCSTSPVQNNATTALYHPVQNTGLDPITMTAVMAIFIMSTTGAFFVFRQK